MSRIDENTPGFIAPGTSGTTIAQLMNPVPRRRYVLSDTGRMGVHGAHVPAAYGFAVKRPLKPRKAKKGSMR